MTRTILWPLGPIVLASAMTLTACTGKGPLSAARVPEPAAAAPTPGAGTAAVPSGGATTAEQFDTTSAEEREAATSGGANGTRLGETVATLGNPADPGFWLETPLVSAPQQGRVVAKANGKSVQLELRPIAGDAGAGSRISLPALRLLEVGLTGLHELEVFGG